MIGLLLIYFIGKSFYQLAFDYNKHVWGFAILGIVLYYAGTFIGGVVLAIIGLLAGSNFVETIPNILLSLISMPFGLLFCWGSYKFLENQWDKNKMVNNNDSLDSNLAGKL
jgi:membrane protein implicated in regulation of membrane protease activity